MGVFQQKFRSVALTLFLGMALLSSGQEKDDYAEIMVRLTAHALGHPKPLEGHMLDVTNMLLDAYHATGKDYFYRMAKRMASRPDVASDAMVNLRLFEEKGDSTFWKAFRAAMKKDTVPSRDMFYRLSQYYQLTAYNRYRYRMEQVLDTLKTQHAIDPLEELDMTDELNHVKRMNSYDIRRNSMMFGNTSRSRPYRFLGRNLNESWPRYLRTMCYMLHKMAGESRTRSGLYPDNFRAVVAGCPTALYRITNSKGVEACFTNYGARLVSLMLPDKEGHAEDVVLGFDNIDDYHLDKQNFGATVGHYAGRITGGKMTIDGQVFKLETDSKGNTAHGGYPGLADLVWTLVSQNDHSLMFRIVSPDGDNGFPGELTVNLQVNLTEDNALVLTYEMKTTRPTHVNLTHHSFFNLSGHLTSTVYDQELTIAADSIAEYDPNKNLTGRLIPVANTAFDFRSTRLIGDSIESPNSQLKVTGGYDHSWALYGKRNTSAEAVLLCHPPTGRQMAVYTTEPVAHIYMANGLKGLLRGKFQTDYPWRSAVCVETMHFADSPNKPHFPSTLLRPGETYSTQTVYQFSVR